MSSRFKIILAAILVLAALSLMVGHHLYQKLGEAARLKKNAPASNPAPLRN